MDTDKKRRNEAGVRLSLPQGGEGVCCPEGTGENSPAFQRWVRWPHAARPGGTAENRVAPDGPRITRISRIKPRLLLPSVQSVKSVVKVFPPPPFSLRSRLNGRLSKLR